MKVKGYKSVYPALGYASPPAGTWLLITATYNQATSNTTLYLNGTFKWSVLGTVDPTGQSNTKNLTVMGSTGSVNDYTHNMTIDEIGLWNRTLSATEISDLYNGGVGIQYTNVFYANITGVVMDSSGTKIANARVVLLNSSDGIVNNTILTNASGDWWYGPIIQGTVVNYTAVGYNPANASQGGNAYPYINA